MVVHTPDVWTTIQVTIYVIYTQVTFISGKILHRWARIRYKAIGITKSMKYVRTQNSN
jgi:hypothetical protein